KEPSKRSRSPRSVPRLRGRVRSRVGYEPRNGKAGEAHQGDVAREAPQAGGAERDELDADQIEGDGAAGKGQTRLEHADAPSSQERQRSDRQEEHDAEQRQGYAVRRCVEALLYTLATGSRACDARSGVMHIGQ